MNIVDYANLYAKRAHQGQRRKYTDEPYFAHPYRVACKLLELNEHPHEHPDYLIFEDTHIAAALLHDVVEDTMYNLADISRDFNWLIEGVVQQLTNTSKTLHADAPREIRKAHDRERLAQASPYVQSIKLADRIDNVSDIARAPESFQSIYLKESRLLLGALDRADPRLREELDTLLKSRGE